ncbi:MAG: DegT/DnrJ/EryC1/StrS family aminotransferase, partial [Thermoanaerobaculales bacterium]|nr:DegT/DnrJ/EryC1/StrS family aminotransferase [Thermoanaerobaculales bacterium]
LFNSGGSANLALFQSLKNMEVLTTGDEPGFSALTWSTNVMPIIQMGMAPVAIDCDPATLNLTSQTLSERLATTDLKGLFITNALGFTGDLNVIRDLCRAENILLLEDNCESLGTELPSGKAGNFSHASTFSFFVAHHMSTIEGGMVCTDDHDLAEMLRIVRANGWDRNLNEEGQVKWRNQYEIKSEFDAKYAFYELGYNLRPTEITGFLGLEQLQYLPENIKAREENFLRLASVLAENEELFPLDHSHLSVLSAFAFPVLSTTPEIREKFMAKFAGAGVEIRPMIAGNIQQQPFFTKHVERRYDLPGTDRIHQTGFYCGCYPELTEPDLEVLLSCLRTW